MNDFKAYIQEIKSLDIRAVQRWYDRRAPIITPILTITTDSVKDLRPDIYDKYYYLDLEHCSEEIYHAKLVRMQEAAISDLIALPNETIKKQLDIILKPLQGTLDRALNYSMNYMHNWKHKGVSLTDIQIHIFHKFAQTLTPNEPFARLHEEFLIDLFILIGLKNSSIDTVIEAAEAALLPPAADKKIQVDQHGILTETEVISINETTEAKDYSAAEVIINPDNIELEEDGTNTLVNIEEPYNEQLYNAICSKVNKNERRALKALLDGKGIKGRVFVNCCQASLAHAFLIMLDKCNAVNAKVGNEVADLDNWLAKYFDYSGQGRKRTKYVNRTRGHKVLLGNEIKIRKPLIIYDPQTRKIKPV